jgi:hypothetical protein
MGKDSQPQPDSHEALVATMIEKMGRDAAMQLDTLTQIHLLVMNATSGRPDSVTDYQAVISQVRAAMGGAFAQRYERSLRSKVDADAASQQADLARARETLGRSSNGQPLVSERELAEFIGSGAAAELLSDLSPEVREKLETLGKKR